MQLMSNDVVEIFTALSKAQGEFRLVEANKVNPHFKSKYADLGALISESREVLSKNGLSVTQPISSTDDGKIILTTILSHTSGQWIKSEFPLTVEKQTPQGFGSALSYFRRYAYSSITGIVSGEEDDDGNTSESSYKNSKNESTKQTNITESLVSESQAQILDLMFKEIPSIEDSVLSILRKKMMSPTTKDIPSSWFERIQKNYNSEREKLVPKNEKIINM